MSLFTAAILTGCGEQEALVTPKEFGKLKEGMTYDQVKEVVGGKEKSKDSDDTFVYYEFDGKNTDDTKAKVTLLFNKDEKLETILEEGLDSPDVTYDSEDDYADSESDAVDAQETETNDEDAQLEADTAAIKEKIEDIAKENYTSAVVSDIEINSNEGTDDKNDYIVLPHFKFDQKNTVKTTKKLIEMYSDDLAANLAKEGNISDITVFWEVPYHLEGSNAAKFNYTKSGKDMAIGDRWYDPSLR